MKTNIRILFTCLVLLPLFSLAQRHTLTATEFYRQKIKLALSGEAYKTIYLHKVIPDKQTAVAVSEPTLFKIYGKAQIESERPYNIYLIDGYWVAEGTLPKGMFGGTFLDIVAKNDGRLMIMPHGK
jgi:hypothetical protein